MNILLLCHLSGVWTRELTAVGFKVDQFDLEQGHDVRLLRYNRKGYHGITAEPPCTSFAVSGARWWQSKRDQALLDALAVVDACL